MLTYHCGLAILDYRLNMQKDKTVFVCMKFQIQ